MTDQFTEIVTLIKRSQYNTQKNVNIDMINLYWQVGEYIHKKIANASWGEGTIKELAQHIRRTQPQLQGFEKRNLYRMKQFFEMYSIQFAELFNLKLTDNQTEILSSPMTQFTDIRNTLLVRVTWTHHLTLMTKTKTKEECEFYLRLCVQENYSVRELERQIKSSLYERVQLGKQKMPLSHNNATQDESVLFRDKYVFEFLDLPVNHDEKDFQKALSRKMKEFILELGDGFIFIEQEYRITVGGTDFYIDLLFFHRDLQCLVAFELKTTAFAPEYIGKLNFYLEALDRKVKRAHERPSVGILLCKEQNNEVVEYALNRFLSPTIVSEYQTFLPDKKLLQQKLHELFEEEFREN
ncbi:YhcG family protein [Chitinophaga sp. HK235]|uniref:PDDEXK nuclease domain-containing protein n=1 Tax=Chitinophaga sp. HK235 TaxID=2952571 RepID=UPI001BAC4C1F|nr:PDDEXK nuclease domain-containing protein [Chitinophaga sp. HK235]